MLSDITTEAGQKMQKTHAHFSEELKTIRSGRASGTLVENVKVTAYEQEMSLKQLANISTPDAKTITIAPWDPNHVAAIEKAIREDKELDLNPVNDGKAVHLGVPPLTAERREQIAKQVNDKVEEAQIALRNIRHEALNEAKALQKDKSISEDDYRRAEKQITDKLENVRKQMEATAEQKRQEVLSG